MFSVAPGSNIAMDLSSPHVIIILIVLIFILVIVQLKLKSSFWWFFHSYLLLKNVVIQTKNVMFFLFHSSACAPAWSSTWSRHCPRTAKKSPPREKSRWRRPPPSSTDQSRSTIRNSRPSFRLSRGRASGRRAASARRFPPSLPTTRAGPTAAATYPRVAGFPSTRVFDPEPPLRGPTTGGLL